MNVAKFANFLIVVSLAILAYCAYQYFDLLWLRREDQYQADIAQIEGRLRTTLEFASVKYAILANGRLAGIIGGLMFILGFGLRISADEEHLP